MGCDIHAYVEYKNKESGSQWSSFGDRINPGRNYHLFGMLADVRNYEEVTPVASGRGMPDDAAWGTKVDNEIRISDHDGDGCCTLDQAMHYSKAYECRIVLDDNGKPRAVTHPDWHSHSWCTPDELELVLRKLGDTYDVEYRALLAAMRSLENDGNIVRLVFWFDN